VLGLLQLNTEHCIASAAAGEVVAILQRRSVDVVACMAEGDEAALRSRPNSTRQVPTMMLCQVSLVQGTPSFVRHVSLLS